MTDAGDTDLRGLAQILGSGWKAIALIVASLVGLVLVLDLVVRTPLYRSETTVLITPSSSESFAATLNDDSDRAMRNELEVAESRPVTDVMEEMFGEDPYIGVTVENGRDVLRFAATDPDAELASDMATLFAATFLEVRESAMIDDFLRTAQAVQKRIDEVDSDLAALGTGELADADATGRDLLIAQRALLVQRLDDVALNSELARAGSARIVSAAEPADDPVSPSPIRDAIVAAVGGLILGVGVVYLRTILQASDPRRMAVDRALADVPTLGEIPVAKGKPVELALAGLLKPQTPMVEAFRTVRTAIQFISGDVGGNVIQVVSARPGDGKTTAAANLAMVLAENGKRTLLIDADIRNPTLSRHFGLTGSSFDLVQCVEGKAKLSDVTRELMDRSTLSIIPSERVGVSGTAELLSSAAFAALLREVSAMYDYVLIDSSPVLAVADSLGIASQADMVVLAVGQETKAPDITRALALLASVDVQISGVIHNGVKITSDTYGSYYGGQQVKRRTNGPILTFRSPTIGKPNVETLIDLTEPRGSFFAQSSGESTGQ